MDCSAESQGTSTRGRVQVSRDQVKIAAAGVHRQGHRGRPGKPTIRTAVRWPMAAKQAQDRFSKLITGQDQQTRCDQKGIKAVKTIRGTPSDIIWHQAGKRR